MGWPDVAPRIESHRRRAVVATAGVGFWSASRWLQGSPQAFRTGKAEEVGLTVIHTNTRRAAVTRTAADGSFKRLTIASGAHRAFRLDANVTVQGDPHRARAAAAGPVRPRADATQRV
jgi:hypothetical protein